MKKKKRLKPKELIARRVRKESNFAMRIVKVKTLPEYIYDELGPVQPG